MQFHEKKFFFDYLISRFFLNFLAHCELNHFFHQHLPNSNPHTFGRISKICEHTGSSEHNWRAVKQLRAALEGLGVVKPAK